LTSVRRATGVALAVTLAVAGCGDDDAPDQFIQCGDARAGPAKTTLIGDSLSVQSQLELRDTIDGAVVDACNGRTIIQPISSDDGIGRIAPLEESDPDWWVVALGTNDAAYGQRAPQVVGVSARQLLDALGPDACVAWVLPAVASPATQAAIDNVAGAQEAIVAELEEQDCYEVVDWPGEVQDDAADLLDVDGIHLTEEGRRRFAELVADAIGD
jgi:lysophospholipase L1-like esterase